MVLFFNGILEITRLTYYKKKKKNYNIVNSKNYFEKNLCRCTESKTVIIYFLIIIIIIEIDLINFNVTSFPIAVFACHIIFSSLMENFNFLTQNTCIIVFSSYTSCIATIYVIPR